MSCDYPNYAIFQCGEDGKRKLVKMFSYNHGIVDSYFTGLINRFDGKYDPNVYDFFGYEAMLLPCGRCTGCRLENSRQWAMRCTLEALQHECNFFVTLTYDDAHLPTNPYKVCYDPETGLKTHEGHSHPLEPKALTDFLKRLRANFQYDYGHVGIRYFACGEYGSKSGRPHYHLILFNCPIPDLKFYKKSFTGQPYWTSEYLAKAWPYGYNVVAECSFDTCAYVARYIMKKQTGPNAVHYDNFDITPEFSRMSRMPGIGRSFFDENSRKIYTYDQVTILGPDGHALQACPPKYFDKVYKELEPDNFEQIRLDRIERMAITERTRQYQTGLSYSAYLRLKTDQRDRVILALKRPL